MNIWDTTEICGHTVNKLKLANTLIQKDAGSMGLKLLACLFMEKELVNGNLSGITKSKDPICIHNINSLHATIILHVKLAYAS